jgi:hypothetical protein
MKTVKIFLGIASLAAGIWAVNKTADAMEAATNVMQISQYR